MYIYQNQPFALLLSMVQYIYLIRKCHFMIRFQRVVLEFEAFKVEYEAVCRYDVLKVYDAEKNDYLLINLCGSMLPWPVSSSGRFMTIVFKTDQSVVASGFVASWRFVQEGE